MSRKTDEAKREIRRKKVAANLVAGLNYRQMSEVLDVSIGTIAADVKMILKRWQKEQVQEIDKVQQLELQRLDRALNAIWPDVIDGKTHSVGAMLKIMERRCKLLGLDAATNIDLTSGGEKLLVSEIYYTTQAAQGDGE